MAWFFGLFGKKTKSNDEQNQGKTLQQKENRSSYYLTSDESKTMGNIDYMRSPIGKHKKVTSTEAPKLSDNSETNNASNGSFSRGSRRSSDPNLDIFRKMAKEIKKP